MSDNFDLKKEKLEINDIILKLQCLSLVIMDIQSVVDIYDYYLDDETRNEVANLCYEYTGLTDRLKHQLKRYFKYEETNNLPRNFEYRAVYKKIFQSKEWS